MNKYPKVGIVIPSYERINYLKEAVESAVNQTYQNLEIIIIDDHSPDPAIGNYLKKIKNPKVKYFINKNRLGTTKNFNRGVKLLGKDVQWCVILNNDDYFDKDFIKEAIKNLQKFPQSKIIHCHQVFVNAEKEIKREDHDFPKLENAEDYLILRSLGKREIRSPSVFFNLNQFKKIGGYPQFPSGMCTDSVFIFSLAFDNSLAFSKESIVYIRIHKRAESETAENLEKKLISIKKMFNYCQEVYKNNPKKYQYKKDKVLGYLKYYARFLNSALLLRKYREVVSKQSKTLAKKSLQKIIRFCQKHKIHISPRFLVLVKMFNFFGVNLEEFFLYKYFNSAILRINKIDKSVRYHFLKNLKLIQ